MRGYRLDLCPFLSDLKPIRASGKGVLQIWRQKGPEGQLAWRQESGARTSSSISAQLYCPMAAKLFVCMLAVKVFSEIVRSACAAMKNKDRKEDLGLPAAL